MAGVGAFLIPGLILGAFAGWAWKRAHRTWQDWRRTKASVGALRRLFWRHGFQGLLMLAAMLAAVWLVTR